MESGERFKRLTVASCAEMEFSHDGQSSNGSVTKLKFVGGNWHCAKARTTKDGLEIEFYGSFERQEILDFFTHIRLGGDDLWIQPPREDGE